MKETSMKQFLKEEQGQSTVEYLLIIMVVVVAISAMGPKVQKLIGELTDKVFKNVGSSVDNLMKGAVK